MQAPNVQYIETPTGYHVPIDHKPTHDLAYDFVDRVRDAVESFQDACGYDTSINEIENRPVSGFWPWTEGGWEAVVCASLDLAYGTGCAPKPIQKIIDNTLNDAAVEFAKDKGVDLPDWQWGKRHTAAWAFIDALPDQSEEREEWWDFMHEWLCEGGTYFYKVRAIYYAPGNCDNETGEPEVAFEAYLNTDLEYGRDSVPWLKCYGQNPDRTHGDWRRVVPVSQITPELIKTMADEAVSDLAAA